MVHFSHCVVFVSDMDRSRAFYRDVLRLPVQCESPKWAEFDTPGVTLALHHFLVSHAGQVFTRQQIVDGIQGPDYPETERAIDVQIVGVRRGLGALGKLIETVRGVGYRFQK